MKKLFPISLALVVVAVGWYFLARHGNEISPQPELPDKAVTTQPLRPETNGVQSESNSVSTSISPSAAPKAEPTAPLSNALMATNLQAWTEAIKGLHKMPGRSDNWRVEQTNAADYIPVVVSQNGQTVFFTTRSIDLSVKNSQGDILEAQLRSPRMNIEETRKLGVALCQMMGRSPDDFLAWCDKVGDHWLDTPLFSTGGHRLGFEIFHSYHDEKPWSISLLIMNP